METAGNVGNNGLRARCAVIRLETEEEVSTRQEQTDDKVLKSLSPLINSMRLFGLYFTRHPHPASEAPCWLSLRSPRRCLYWYPSRIYATVVFVVMWLNMFRYLTSFDGKEALGLDLFVKIGGISDVLFSAVLFTAYYVASHMGSLDRVFRQMILSTADISPKYSRWAVIMTFVCWTMVVSSTVIYVYPIFLGNETPLLYINTYRIPKPYEYIIKVVLIVLQVYAVASWVFPQPMANNNFVALFAAQFHPNPKSLSNFPRLVEPSELTLKFLARISLGS